MLRVTLNSGARWGLTLLAVSALAVSALAHHGWSGYDETKPVTLTGVIKEAGWDNPHGFVKLQVENGKGKIWTATLAPPSRMESRGLKKAELKVGETATVIGAPSRTNPDEIKAERISIGAKSINLKQ